MPATSFKEAIDAAAEICGGQNALARSIGYAPNALTEAKAGRRPLPKEKIEAVARILNMDPADLWKLSELANLDRRNPFRVSAPGALASYFAASLCVILSATSMPSEASIGAASQPVRSIGHSIH